MKLKIKQNSYTFRRWSRKSYAVLNSLHRVTKIGVMCVSYSMLTQPGKTYAQADSTQVINNLKEVVVSAQRAPVTYSNVARVVHVIPRSEIANAPVVSLNELLDYVPGVDIRQRGNNGVQADVSIQGGTFDQSLILLNGINISDPQTGHLSMNLPFDLESVSRIEVLTGAASRVFGANAFSGAVNIITTPSDKNFVRANVSAGDFGFYKAGAAVQYNIKSFYSSLNYSRSASNGYIHNTGYKNQSTFYQGGIRKTNYLINFQGGYNTKNYGANSFYASEYSDQYEENATYFGGLNASFGNTVKIKPAVYWKRNYDHYILIRNNPGLYQNFHYTDVYGSNLNSEYKWAAGTTTLGIEFRNESIYSTRLGIKTNDSIQVKGENIYYNRSATRYNYSFFAEHSFTLKKITVSGGVMLNHHSALEKKIVLYPGVDVAYRIGAAAKLYGTYNRSLRLPTFTDLYYTGPRDKNNPELKPEEANHFEAGFKYGSNGIVGNLSAFYRMGKNMIDRIKQPDGLWQPQNITELDTRGLEVSATIIFTDLLGYETLLTKAGISYNYTEISKDAGSFESAYLLDNLKHKIAVNLTHKIYKNISAVWYTNYQDRNGNYEKYNPVTKTKTIVSYNPFLVLDGRIMWQPAMLTIFAEVSNIFDTDYYDFGNIAQPGRWIKAGVSVNIGI